MQLQLVNATLDLSPTVFEIFTHFAGKWLVFPTAALFDASYSGGTPCDINVIYAPLKSRPYILIGYNSGYDI